jgi:acetolactate synthase regulatory subunit
MSSTAIAPTRETPPTGCSAPAELPMARRATAPLRRYELTTTGAGDALMRVISLVRRRCGEVVALEFAAGDRQPGCSAVIKLTVAIEPGPGASLALRLAGLIDVVAVREY